MIVLHSQSVSPAVRRLRKKHEVLLNEDESLERASSTIDGLELHVVSSLTSPASRCRQLQIQLPTLDS